MGAVDPKWWDEIADYCKQNGIVTYEQDWLDRTYNASPTLQSSPVLGEAWLDNMSKACAERNVTISVARYRAGEAPILEATDAMATLAAQRLVLEQALFDYQSARVRLREAAGK